MNVFAVFDCMVFLQAATNEAGPASACLRLLEEGKLLLVVSPEVLAEVKEVLSRPALQRKFPSLTAERVDEFMRGVEERGIMIGDVPKLGQLPARPRR